MRLDGRRAARRVGSGGRPRSRPWPLGIRRTPRRPPPHGILPAGASSSSPTPTSPMQRKPLPSSTATRTSTAHTLTVGSQPLQSLSPDALARRPASARARELTIRVDPRQLRPKFESRSRFESSSLGQPSMSSVTAPRTARCLLIRAPRWRVTVLAAHRASWHRRVRRHSRRTSSGLVGSDSPSRRLREGPLARRAALRATSLVLLL